MDAFGKLAVRLDHDADRIEKGAKNYGRSPCRDTRAQQLIKAAVYRDCARQIRIAIEESAAAPVVAHRE